ncbi:hypothetical protein [Pseudonocardia sp.]|uniref:hypothetical protein n=1 Tax=Pseudonocardia sp. TaxID=60912 RepID=UPI00263214BF|nr:hypothetical protein [Pseudonocardia sp.]
MTGRDAYPWQIGLAAVVWMALGALLISSGIGFTGSDADTEQVDKISGSLGADTVVSTAQHGGGVLWILLGIAVLLVAALLAIGQGWSRYVLFALGFTAVIALGVAARWEVVLAMGFFVAGSLPLLAPRAHRYLAP